MKLFKKEREVIELALEYLDAATACVANSEEVVTDYLAGDRGAASELRTQVRRLEHKADVLQRAIGTKLYSGAYLPLIRGDIYSLIEAFDRVPNAAEACATFFMSEKPGIPEEFIPAFQKILEASCGAMNPLQKSVKTFFDTKGKVKAIRRLNEEISIQESLVDEMEWDLTNAIFDSSFDLSVKLHLRKALERIVHISDRAEDAGDQLGLVAVKSVM